MRGLQEKNCKVTVRKQAEVEASWASTGFPQPLRVREKGGQWPWTRGVGRGEAWHLLGPGVAS